MAKDWENEYAVDAVDYEKQAKQYFKESDGKVGNRTVYKGLLNAGDKWLESFNFKYEGGKGKESPSDLKNALKDYNLALKHRPLNVDDKGIRNTIKSVESVLEKGVSKPSGSKDIASAVASRIAFSSVLILSSFSMTGAVIGGITASTFNYAASACFAIGLVFALIHLRKTKKQVLKRKK